MVAKHQSTIKTNLILMEKSLKDMESASIKVTESIRSVQKQPEE